MKLFEVLGDLIKHDLKTNRGRKVRDLVKAASQKGNPSTKNEPMSGSGYAMEIPKAGDTAQMADMF